MRIVLLPSAFRPHIGGVETLTESLARSLIASGHVVEVWTSRSPGDGLPDTEAIEGLPVRRFVFDAPRTSLRAVALWPPRAGSTLRRMHEAAREFRPNVLHVQCFGVNGVYAAMLSQLTRLPLVVTLQGETFMDDQDIYRESFFLRTGLRLGLRRARHVTACSNFALDDASHRFRLDRTKARVIFNGISLVKVESPMRVPFDRFVFSVGRIVYRKGFDLLLDAWKRIEDRHAGTGLVIAGTGSEEPHLRSLVRDRGLENRVHFAGKLSSSQVAAMMKAAEVFVMPSRIEAFGIVVLEAWRARTPAIVSSNGGTREFVEDGVTGLVVSPTDPAVLAEAVDKLLVDERLRSRLAHAAAERLPAFEWSKISQQYEVVYALATSTDRLSHCKEH
jgi:glycogen synthase